MLHKTIETLLKETVKSMGYTLWGCEVLSQGRHSMLRVYIDNESGISLEDCEQVSRRVGAVLDVEDPFPGQYRLEVSSPGIPRPLFHREQYQQFVGKNIQIKLFQPVDGRRKYAGIIVSANDSTLVLDVSGVKQDILFSNIAKAMVE